MKSPRPARPFHGLTAPRRVDGNYLAAVVPGTPDCTALDACGSRNLRIEGAVFMSSENKNARRFESWITLFACNCGSLRAFYT